MPTKALALDFYGTQVALRGDDEGILEELGRDFAYFLAPEARGRPDVSLELKRRAPAPERVPRRAHWRWRSARVNQKGPLRTIDYEGRALLEYDLREERGVLTCGDGALLHELAYLAVLSRAGERMDRADLHRVHALGFTFQGKGGLLLLPSGGGKSKLGLELLRRGGFGLLSDDTPLVKDGGRALAAFPLRLGLRGEDWRGIPERFLRPFHRRRFGDKRVVDLDYFRGQVSAVAPLRWILVGSRNGAPGPDLKPCSAARTAAALAANLVLGLGTPQVLELMAPCAPYAQGALRLAKIAAKRAACAARAAATARCGRFRLGSDVRANAAALEAFLVG